MIRLNGLKKQFKDLKILDFPNEIIFDKPFTFIHGRSGSGKTTLMNILALLDNEFSGEYLFDDENILNLSASELSKFRNKNIGIVFQFYHLIPTLNVIDNILLPVIKAKFDIDSKREFAFQLLKKFDLVDKYKSFPKNLSGGEMQRVAVIRACINSPKYLITDEPTGNLDDENEKIIMNFLKEISDNGQKVILVSHNMTFKILADESYTLAEKTILKDL